MNAWQLFFGWPEGGVWSNLIANLVWVPLAGVGGYLLTRVIKRHLDRHHEALKQHITNELKK